MVAESSTTSISQIITDDDVERREAASSTSHTQQGEGGAGGAASTITSSTTKPTFAPAKGDREGVPTSWQLFKSILRLLFSPKYRGLVLINMLIHLTSWLFFTSLLWAHFLKYLPFNVAFKIYFFGLMAAFAITTDVWGTILNAVSVCKTDDSIEIKSRSTATLITQHL